MQGFIRVIAIVVLLQVSSIHDAVAKEIRDWSVWCKSDLECTLQTENSDEGIYGFGFVRGPKANAETIPFLSTRYELSKDGALVVTLDDNTNQSFELNIRSAESRQGVWYFDGQDADATLLKAIMAANKMTVKFDTSDGPKSVALSVSGATGSALYVDEAQMRLGNKDALKASGDGTPQDAVSRVARLRSSADLPGEVRSAWEANNGECSEDYGDGDLIERFGGERIEGKDGAYLFVLPCGGPGAYNLPSAAYMLDTTENRARRIYFPTMAEKGPTLVDTAINTSWDPVGETLDAFYKGRGLGDCGTASNWQWDGYAYSQLVLVKEFSKDNCDGEYDDWPQVWPR